jgi:hypothetical protein
MTGLLASVTSFKFNTHAKYYLDVTFRNPSSMWEGRGFGSKVGQFLAYLP